jgi:hypothetical protein
LVIAAELLAAENLWLHGLRSGLTAAGLERILIASQYRDLQRIGAYLNVIADENSEQLEATMKTRTFVEIFNEIELKAGPTDKWIDTGRAEGVAIGEARDEAKKAAETAGKMKQEGFPVDAISRLTGLSAEEIKRLR